MMKTVTRALIQLSLMVALLTPATLNAATYYVATNGNDGVNCTTAQNVATPKRTIQSGVGCLNAGDTLSIRGGIYNESVNIGMLTGTSSQWITIQGHPGDARPVLRPTVVTEASVINSPHIRIPAYIIYKDFEIDDGLISAENHVCLSLIRPNQVVDNLILRNCSRNAVAAFSTSLEIRNTQILSCGRIQPAQDLDTKGVGIYIGPDGNPSEDSKTIGGLVTVENSLIDGCRGGGIVIHYKLADNIVVRNNIIRNFGLMSTWPPPAGFQNQYGTGVTIGGAGVIGTPGPQYNQIYGNLIYNGRSNGLGQCFNFWGTGEGNAILNNTCHNVDIGIITLCDSNNDFTIRNNIFSSVSTELYKCGNLTGIYSNNLVNPDVIATFVDAANGDFRLKDSSAAIGATIATGTDWEPSRRPSSPINLRVTRN